MMPVVPFSGRVVVASAPCGLRRGGALMILFMSVLAPYKGGPTGREVEARPVNFPRFSDAGFGCRRSLRSRAPIAKDGRGDGG